MVTAPPTIDAVIPARNEAPTVAGVVSACRGAAPVREVLVVDDGSTDATAEEALGAGAKVVRLDGVGGSKAHAMAAGVEASDADAILFVDADLLGLTPSHLEDICRPYLAGEAVMSLGCFDYGWLNPLVLLLPPTTGERIIPRWVFEAVPPAKRDGYTIEMMINEVVAERHFPVTAQVMEGVTHRTKRQKFGFLDGYRRTVRMFWDLAALVGRVPVRNYWFYLRRLTLEV